MPTCQALNCKITATDAVFKRSGGLCRVHERKNKSPNKVQRKPIAVVKEQEPESDFEFSSDSESEPAIESGLELDFQFDFKAASESEFDFGSDTDSESDSEIFKKKTSPKKSKGLVLCPGLICGGYCHPKTLKARGGCAKCFPNTYVKKSIPHAVKTAVWEKWMGRVYDARCYCCESTMITSRDFCAGHVRAESKGGDISVENLRPICLACNSSMGSQHMEDFKKLLPKKQMRGPAKNETVIARFGGVVDDMHGRLIACVEQPDGTIRIKQFNCYRDLQGLHTFRETQIVL